MCERRSFFVKFMIIYIQTNSLDIHTYVVLCIQLFTSNDNRSFAIINIFQQDNDPKHAAKRVKELLIFKIANQLHTPSQSLELNPIKHLWDLLGKRIRTHDERNWQQLQLVITEEWGSITSEITKKLVYAMKNRLQEVLEVHFC